MSWQLKGTYFESCNCEAACPCVFLSPPTEEECTVLVAWHIDQGTDGDTSLDGLDVAMAIHAPGHMMHAKWRAALYLDERAEDAQQQALTRSFAGQVKVNDHPMALSPGFPAVVARSRQLSYNDHGMTWAISERNGFYSAFEYEAA
ncbi:MAG: DUF1326 domain-containing protein [Pseudomonadota bacterium]